MVDPEARAGEGGQGWERSEVRRLGGVREEVWGLGVAGRGRAKVPLVAGMSGMIVGCQLTRLLGGTDDAGLPSWPWWGLKVHFLAEATTATTLEYVKSLYIYYLTTTCGINMFLPLVNKHFVDPLPRTGHCGHRRGHRLSHTQQTSTFIGLTVLQRN